MLRDVTGDAEAAELNGASIINTYRCPVSVIGILQHVAADVRTEGAKAFSPAPPFALTFFHYIGGGGGMQTQF